MLQVRQEQAAALAEIPNPARPAAPSNSSCPPDCPHGSYGCCWENVKQLLGNTNTMQRQKTPLLPINVFQVFKCSKKTHSGLFACWRMRGGRSSVTKALIEFESKNGFPDSGIHKNDFFFPTQKRKPVLGGAAWISPKMPVTRDSSGRAQGPCLSPLLAGREG